MKHSFKLAAIFLAAVAPWSESDAVELSKDFTLALDAGLYSQYWSRGMSQTQGDPALQGSATLVHSSGLFAGVWSSNVDFGHGSKTRQEIDYYLGYSMQLADDVSLELTYLEYEYPKQADLNYSEYYAKLNAHGFIAGGYYSDDLWGDESMLYSFVGYETTLPGDIGLKTRYGQVDYKDPVFVSGNGSTRSKYNEWQIELNKELLGLKWSLSYADSNLSKVECLNFNGFDDVCSATVIAGISKSF
ncbi:TorF family putative porin [Pseudomonas sp. MG-2]|uniref:TorF family putative porin n=1 Tax=Pseudomonas sp. MG-2 TaxID=405714 RepID=UPI001C001277|nr:TorF family putative porin [Pseudomonas sp. MG-2]MBT9236109.1 TorF family putative porin [Pseudomonas sp. MG-2]